MTFATAAGGLAIAVGGVVLFGWVFDFAALKGIGLGGVLMAPSTALSFVLAGLALWLHLAREPAGAAQGHALPRPSVRRRVAQGLAGLVLLNGFLTFTGHLFNREPVIDVLFYPDAAAVAAGAPSARMVLMTACNFVLTGGALLALLGAPGRWRERVLLAVRVAAGLVMVIAVTVLLGYAGGIRVGDDWGYSAGMAFHTAGLFVVLSAGLLAAAWREAPLVWAIGKRVTVAFAAGLLVLFLEVALVFRTTASLESTARGVAHSNEVRFHVSELLSVLQQVESMKRGYLLTGQEAFLVSYLPATKTTDSELAALVRLTADHPAQQRRLEALGSLVSAKREFTTETIEVFRRQGEEAAEGLVQTGRGKTLMDEIGRLLVEMDDEEEIMVGHRKAEAEAAVSRAVFLLPLGGLASIGLFVTVFLVLNREIDRRRGVERSLRLQGSALDAAANAIIITDRKGAIEWANAAFTTLSGYGADEIRGRNPQELLNSGRNSAALYKDLWETILDGRVWGGELINRRKDGSLFTEEMTITPVRDEGAGITHFIAVKRDITARKEAEEALRASEEFNRRLIASSSDCIKVLDPDGKLLSMNEGGQRLLEIRDPNRYLSGCWISYWQPEDQPRVREAVAAARAGKTGRFQGFCPSEAGSPRWWDVIITPIREADRSVRQLLAVSRDITEHKQAEDSIQRQTALLDAANDAIFLRTLDGTVTYWNAGAERLYGWTRAEVLGRKSTELSTRVVAAAYETAYATVLHQGAWSGEFELVNKEGRAFTVFCRWTLLRDAHGQPAEILAINTDITEKKQLEANFLRAQRMEGIGSLAAGVAHDLNNILAPILMGSSMLREAVVDPASRRMIDTMQGCAKRGANIIKQLLTFARGQPGAKVPLPVRHVLNEMGTIIRETFPKNITVDIRMPKDLWPVLADSTQVHQSLMNLCVNARDAMAEGGTLRLAAENLRVDEATAALLPDAKPGTYVCVSVTDTGTGI
ncbi:MAG: PAS domain S-box protein, partial [Candidatus Didemnitutus sp.]|nr:PAS domain S-box protein [Candidatus Didemnitutus sp.]